MNSISTQVPFPNPWVSIWKKTDMVTKFCQKQRTWSPNICHECVNPIIVVTSYIIYILTLVNSIPTKKKKISRSTLSSVRSCLGQGISTALVALSHSLKAYAWVREKVRSLLVTSLMDHIVRGSILNLLKYFWLK